MGGPTQVNDPWAAFLGLLFAGAILFGMGVVLDVMSDGHLHQAVLEWVTP